MKHRILHLCSDGNFIDHSMFVFEYFYPDQNVFFLRPKFGKEITHVKRSNFIKFNPYYSSDYLDQIDEINNRENFDIIVIHGLNKSFINIVKRINPDRKIKVYWIFWGYELYRSLGEEGKISLLDNQSIFSWLTWHTPTRYNCLAKKILGRNLYYKNLEAFLPLCDYFCFWLYEDFLLLKKFYPNNLQYKWFSYDALFRDDTIPDETIDFEKNKKEIRISHSASTTANHLTVMKILKKIDRDNEYKKVFPLAYGNENVKKTVLKYGSKWFGKQFAPILEYEKKEDYLKTLSKVGIAIFGQLRQEAAGNITPLLGYGAKVFLRRNSPLYQYYKKKGYIVFSMEDDLKSVDDLSLLTHEQMLHNADVRKEDRIYYEDFMPCLFNE
ncbi:MAG: hypothetical protein IKY01_10405 [Prevotella sp.]|nr:hypothetical protein [Prevotella sp.]